MKWAILLLLALPLAAQQHKPASSAKAFWIVNSMQFAAVPLDVESGQRCIEAKTCHEANPLMPSGRAGQYAVQFGIAGLSTLWSYHEWKLGKSSWFFAPMVVTEAHGIAAGINFSH